MQLKALVISTLLFTLPFASHDVRAAISLRSQLALAISVSSIEEMDIFGEAPPDPGVAEVREFLEGLSLGVFGTPLDEDSSAWFLDTPITAPGSYTGANDLGQPFTLLVAEVNTIATQDIVASAEPSDAAWAQSVNFDAIQVIGSMLGTAGSEDVVAEIISFDDSGEPSGRRHWLVPMFDDSYDSAINNALDPNDPEVNEHAECFVVTFTRPILNDDNEQCEGCDTQLENDIAQVDAQLATDMLAAENSYDNAISAATGSLQQCRQIAAAGAVTCMAGVLVKFGSRLLKCAALGVFSLGCNLVAAAVAVTGTAVCAAGAVLAGNLCDGTHDTAVQSAKANRQNARVDARNTARIANAVARQNWESCREANGCNAVIGFETVTIKFELGRVVPR